MDSGACHICNNVDHFVNLQHLEKPMEVIMGDGCSLKAAKCGMVELYIRSPDGKDRILKLGSVNQSFRTT